ncbi:hypothetical protein [uncultured Ramlibacter sp.]|uniref:hypothetical protein n=1 Tax=uncultured Ramlibacter sp. TaxID=260755 RepID=UPI00262C98ED|nr:hypothetical protein [uncultured Ramlibacter sp.]
MSQAIEVPVSAGELFDKQTILRIKQERISDAAKLAHVGRELGLLDGIAAGLLQGAPQAADVNVLVAELHAVNSTLWDLENSVRAAEAAQRFDAAFIGSARSIYAGNDRRAALKLRINQLLGSDIVEVKSHTS